ncbi:Spo0B domain-containing protein [Syntrophomonas curvata]
METERAVDILRRVRHDFGNYLQVILGYIDLKRPEQARDYILGVVEDLASERIIFENLEEEAVLYFYQQLLMARDLGIILRYKELGRISWAVLQGKLESLSRKFRAMEDDPVVNLSLYGTEDGVRMLFAWQQPEPGQLEVIIEELR